MSSRGKTSKVKTPPVRKRRRVESSYNAIPVVGAKPTEKIVARKRKKTRHVDEDPEDETDPILSAPWPTTEGKKNKQRRINVGARKIKPRRIITLSLIHI